MPTYCQNPLCEHESLREVRVSVNTPSDETRSLCEACKVAFDWGLQHGRLTAMPQQIWVAAVTHNGSVIHAVAVSDKVKAVAALAAYFRMQEGYRGPAELPGLCSWMPEQDPRLGIELFPGTLDLS